MELTGEIKAVVFNHERVSVGDKVSGRKVVSLSESTTEKYQVPISYNTVTLEGDDGIIARFKNIPILGSQGIGGVSFVIFQQQENEDGKRVYHVGDEVDGRRITRISVNRDRPPAVMPNFAACDKAGKRIIQKAEKDAGIEVWYSPFEAF